MVPSQLMVDYEVIKRVYTISLPLTSIKKEKLIPNMYYKREKKEFMGLYPDTEQSFTKIIQIVHKKLKGRSRRRNNTTMKIGQGLSSSIFQDSDLIHSSIGDSIAGSVNLVSNFDSFLNDLIQLESNFSNV